MLESYRADLLTKIKILNERLWENRVSRPNLDEWLSNFTGHQCERELEQSHALLLLSQFLYLGHDEVRELLRAMFQDLIRQPLTIEARMSVPDKNDFAAIHEEFLTKLSATRFVGIGSPAESGTHILYDFRSMNGIPADYFLTSNELLSSGEHADLYTWANENVQLVVFLDDFCGTGHQVTAYSESVIRTLRDAATASGVAVEFWYLTMIATSTGLSFVRKQGIFDRVECVSELDDTYKAFGDSSQYYTDPDSNLDKDDGKAISKCYGELLVPGHSLGYGNCQLLIGFRHNTPDNTLPIFWQAQSTISWSPLFPRINKVISTGLGM